MNLIFSEIIYNFLVEHDLEWIIPLLGVLVLVGLGLIIIFDK